MKYNICSPTAVTVQTFKSLCTPCVKNLLAMLSAELYISWLYTVNIYLYGNSQYKEINQTWHVHVHEHHFNYNIPYMHSTSSIAQHVTPVP